MRHGRAIAIGAGGFVAIVVALHFLSGPRVPQPVADGAAAIRAKLFAGELCYLHRADLCIRDPDFVDPIVAKTLHGTTPRTDVEVDEALRDIGWDYELATGGEDGVRRLEKLIADRFANPVVSEPAPRELDVELGVLPGPMRIWRGIWIDASAHLEDFAWKPSELGARLAALAAAHPETARITLHLDIVPSNLGLDHYTYTWTRATGVIDVVTSGKWHDVVTQESEPVDLDGLARGEAKISWGSRPR